MFDDERFSPLSFENKETVLIDGGAGFVGSNLSRFLVNRGYNVIAVDNLITGYVRNIEKLMDSPNFHFFKLDITSRIFKKIFYNIPVHKIFHLACPTGVPNIKKLGEEMLLTSSAGTFNVLEIAKRHKAKLIFSSSAEIYGQPQVSPQLESYTGNVDPIGPRSAYEEGKRFSETIVRQYAEKYGVDAKIVRIFNTYGPGMSLHDQRVMPQFLKSIINNQDLKIYGNGEQTRTFLYVDDLIQGLFKVMENGIPGEAYNIGGDQQMTIKKLADIMKGITNFQNGTVYEPHFIEDHSSRQPSVQKVSEFGWVPQISLEEGLRRMIKANGFKME